MLVMSANKNGKLTFDANKTITVLRRKKPQHNLRVGAFYFIFFGLFLFNI